jgi:hypothetical protein
VQFSRNKPVPERLQDMPCDDFALFFDGELPDERVDAYREHLAGCEPCQWLLGVTLVVDAAAARYVRKRWPWWRKALAWVLG